VSGKLRRLLALFEEQLYLRYSEGSVRGYLSHTRHFLEWLEENAVELPSVKPDDLLAHQSALLARRKRDGRAYSVGFLQNRLSALKSFFRFLVKRGYLLLDPAAGLEMPRAERRLPRVILTRDEARRILEAARGDSPQELRDRAVLETFYATGIRVSELRGLTPFDVDTEERSLRVGRGKGGRGRAVPLTRAAARAIDAYVAFGRPQLAGAGPTGALFLSDRGLAAQGPTLNLMIRRYAERARVKKHVTCHTFRHSVATHLLRGRADIRHIQAFLGHSSLQTTQRYTRVEISDLKEVVRRAHPRGR